MFRSTFRTAAVALTAAALAGAPAAFARPADNGPQLNYTQLRLIHGHVPPEPVTSYAVAPGRAVPGGGSVHVSAPSGGTSPVPWIAGGAAALLFAAFGLVRFTGVRPQRRRQPAA